VYASGMLQLASMLVMLVMAPLLVNCGATPALAPLADGGAVGGGSATDGAIAFDAARIDDAALSPDGASLALRCGATARCKAKEVCCFDTRAATASCADPSNAPCQTGRASCSKPSDCPGTQRCCGSLTNTIATNCYAKCPATEVEICERASDCTSGRCQALAAPNWLSACSP
jgi:hypothetical protein